MRWLAVILFVTLAACTTKMDKAGRTESTVDPRYLLKSEVDRIADTNRAEVVNGLLLIADKLYKRNPKEWKKSGAVSREAAVERLRQRTYRNWPEFTGLREGAVASLAFTEAYAGDRVMALMYGLLSMLASVIPRFAWPSRPPDIYLHYADSIGVAEGQGFTIHHATGWYLNFGVLGILVGALLWGWVWARCSVDIHRAGPHQSRFWMLWERVLPWRSCSYC